MGEKVWTYGEWIEESKVVKDEIKAFLITIQDLISWRKYNLNNNFSCKRNLWGSVYNKSSRWNGYDFNFF